METPPPLFGGVARNTGHHKPPPRPYLRPMGFTYVPHPPAEGGPGGPEGSHGGVLATFGGGVRPPAEGGKEPVSSIFLRQAMGC